MTVIAERENDVPDGWKSIQLGKEINKIEYGYTASATEKPVGPRLLRITDIQDNGVDWNSVPYCKCSQYEKEKYRLFPNDILIARIGATTGKSYLFDNKKSDSVFASYLIRIRPQIGLLPEFLYQFTKSKKYWAQINSQKGAHLKGGINIPILRHLSILLPPLSEQNRIAAILTTLDDAIKRSRKATAEMECLKTGTMQMLLTNGIGHAEFKDNPEVGRVPKEWDIGKLGDFGKIKYGFAQPPNSKENGVPMICAKDIDRGSIDWNTVNKIDPKSIPNGRDPYLKKWDIIIVRSGVNTGDIGLFNFDKNAVAGYDLVFTPNQECVDPTFVSKYLLGSHRQSHFKAIGVRSAQSHLNSEQIYNTPIVLPPLEEQQKISSILSSIDNKLTFQHQRTAHYEKLKQGLMNELLTGKRRVKVT